MSFRQDDIFRFRDPTTNKRYAVPIQYLKPGETTTMKKIKTQDSRDAIADAIERNTAVMERVVEVLARLEGPRKRFTVDHNAPPGAPNSYESVLRHFRTLPAGQTQAASDFEQAARRHHRKGLLKPPEEPQAAGESVRTQDAGESMADEFTRKANAAGAAMRKK